MRWLWHWGPAIAAMLAIFFVSGQQKIPDLPAGFSNHTGHLVAYAGLAVLLVRALAAARWSGVTASAARVAILIAALYGITDELHQKFVPGRTATVSDWIADLAGAILGASGVLVTKRFVRRVETSEV